MRTSLFPKVNDYFSFVFVFQVQFMARGAGSVDDELN